MSFEPIIQQSVAERVARRLLAMIRAGQLKAGERLPPERELAILLGVGRPAVREAIRGLALLGLLKIRPGEGTFVGTLSVRELIEPLEMIIDLNAGAPDTLLETLFDTRLAIEPSVAALAAQHITAEQLIELESYVASEQALTNDAAGFSEADLAFHEIVIDACGNPLLQSIAASLYQLGKKSRAITSKTPALLARTLDDHRAIVAALRARDAEAAAGAMRNHLLNVRTAFHRAGADADAAKARAATPAATVLKN